MDCPKCKVRLIIKQTFCAGGSAKTQRAECPKCAMIVTLITHILNVQPEKGFGAHSVAKRIRESLPAVRSDNGNVEGPDGEVSIHPDISAIRLVVDNGQ